MVIEMQVPLNIVTAGSGMHSLSHASTLANSGPMR